MCHIRQVGATLAPLLRLLIRDRFSDFAGDRLVSPVREAAAQAQIAREV